MSSQVSKENTTLAILNSINYHMRVTDAHMLNEKQEQEDVCIAILQYLWEQFRGEVGPCSSAQHAGVDSYHLCLRIHCKNLICALKKISLWQLSYSYLLSDIRTMSQGRTATKNKHLPPDLHLSSNSHSLYDSQGKGDYWLWHPGLL